MLIPCSVKFAISQSKAGKVLVACCENVFSHITVAPAFVYPAGAVKSKYNVTSCAVLPVFAATLVMCEPPDVKLFAVISAIVTGSVIVPSCAILPPLFARLASVQSKASDKPFTVTDIDCTAVQVPDALSYASMYIVSVPPI